MGQPWADRYGIRTTLEVDGVPIKLEIVSEGRIKIEGDLDSVFGVPTLSRSDMFAEMLLANADRGLERSMMIREWGGAGAIINIIIVGCAVKYGKYDWILCGIYYQNQGQRSKT